MNEIEHIMDTEGIDFMFLQEVNRKRRPRYARKVGTNYNFDYYGPTNGKRGVGIVYRKGTVERTDKGFLRPDIECGIYKTGKTFLVSIYVAPTGELEPLLTLLDALEALPGDFVAGGDFNSRLDSARWDF